MPKILSTWFVHAPICRYLNYSRTSAKKIVFWRCWLCRKKCLRSRNRSLNNKKNPQFWPKQVDIHYSGKFHDFFVDFLSMAYFWTSVIFSNQSSHFYISLILMKLYDLYQTNNDRFQWKYILLINKKQEIFTRNVHKTNMKYWLDWSDWLCLF